MKQVGLAYRRVATETKCCVFQGAGDGKYGLSYSSSHDLSCLVVDAEDQMARFVAKTFRLCSRLVVRANTYWTWEQRLLLCYWRGKLPIHGKQNLHLLFGASGCI